MEALHNQPSSVRIRKLEPWIVTTHSRIAQEAGLALEEHLRRLLKEQALRAQIEFADEMTTVRAEIAAQFPANFPKSEDLIRAVRDES
jgi:hypothetical protein